jgi:hypothetical protein
VVVRNYFVVLYTYFVHGDKTMICRVHEKSGSHEKIMVAKNIVININFAFHCSV